MDKYILDSIDPKLIGSKLQDARKACSFTQQQVAERVGIARTTLVAIEKGERRLTNQELTNLSKIYNKAISSLLKTDVFVDSFFSQFRTASGLVVEEIDIRKSTERLQVFAENYLELERLCNSSITKIYPSLYNIRGTSPEQAAEEVANMERSRLGIGDGPISNLRERLETDVGLRIFYFPMPSRIGGLFAYNDKLGGCIGINSNHPSDRRYWSLVHEYAHFLTSRYQAEITFLIDNKKSSINERFAESFAKHFLMPSVGLNQRFSNALRSKEDGITLADICSLASLYQVSVQALTLRLEELGRLPLGTWERLIAKGFKVRQAQQLLGIDVSVPIKNLLPQKYQYLAVLAYNKEFLSEGQLSEILQTDRVSARALVKELIYHINAQNENGFDNTKIDLTLPLDGR